MPEKRAASKLNLEFAKRFAAEKMLQQILNYMEGDPDTNIPRIFNLMKSITRVPLHKEMINNIRELYLNNPATKSYMNRLFTEVDRDVRNRLMCNFVVNSLLLSSSMRYQVEKDEDIHVPYTILIDPTSACNLKCKGCWAGEYAHHDELEPELLDRILAEAKELGICSIVMSGGEPFCYPHLLDIAAKYDDMVFMVYTNGTKIDDPMADRLREVGNIAPTFSLEGWEEETDARRGAGVFQRVVSAMGRLKQRGVVFGASVTINSQNVEEVTSDRFIDFMLERGVRYMWSFHYIPVGRAPDLSMMVTPEQRQYLAGRIGQLRKDKGMPIADFWNDGEYTGGCIAGGQCYFHLTAKGDVEPCAFAHFAVDNIREKSLRQVLRNPLFTAYQKRQPFDGNLLLPCPIIDHPQALRTMVAESGARPTHPGAETILTGEIAEFLDQRSAAWRELAAPIWEKRHPEQKIS